MIRTRTFYIALRALLIVAGLLVVALLIVGPLGTPWLDELGLSHGKAAEILSIIQMLQIWLMDAVTMGWFFVLGSCLASFLNVVAWRLPRGKPITGSSHCPHCDTRLAFFDNLPVLGWLRNEGRCRTCRAPISVRYLVAEIALGAIFLILATVVFQTGAANWPIRPIDRPAGFEHLLFDPQWDLILILAWHLTLVSFLFTVMLIDSERRRVPLSIWMPGLAAAICVASFVPFLILVPWHDSATLSSNRLILFSEWINPVAGLIVGVSVGWLVQFATSEGAHKNNNCGAVSFAAIGLFLGWQATLVIGTLALTIRLLQTLFWRRSIGANVFPPCASVLLATFQFLMLWRTLYEMR